MKTRVSVSQAIEILNASVENLLDLILSGQIDPELGTDLCKIHLDKLKQVERKLKNGQAEENWKIKKRA